MVPFESSLSKLSENHKIVEIGSTEFKLCTTTKALLNKLLIECIRIMITYLNALSVHAQVALKDPLLYGDYGTALTPEQPRVYEDVQDYDAAKGFFDEVS